MASLAHGIGKVVTAAHAAVYRASKGRVGSRIGANQVCLLTTTGRTSGQPRTTPLTLFPRGEDLVVVASNNGSDRHPAWYHNLRADPRVQVQIGGVVRPMIARTVTDEERAVIWPDIVASAKAFGGYERKTDRAIPVVLLSPQPAG
jgi:deazaflavin-dependent oxidoreductase (nitroreductase family)